MADLLGDQYSEERIPCSICGRSFAPEVLKKHSNVCKKSAATAAKRKPFDSSKQRVLEGELSLKQIKEAQKKEIKPPKSHWREKHQDFINAVRNARGLQAAISSGGPLPPPPPPSANPDYVQCPHCSRRFNQSAAERHISFCKDKQSKLPKDKPGSSASAKPNTRVNPSKPKAKTASTSSTSSTSSPSSTGPARTAPSATKAPLKGPAAAAKTSAGGQTSLVKNSTLGSNSSTRQTVAKVPAVATSSATRMPTAGSTSSTRIATGGSASSTRIAAGGSISTTQITSANAAPLTKHGAGGPVVSAQAPAGDANSMVKKPTGGLASSSRIPAGSSASSTKIPSGNAAASTKIPVGSAPSSRIPVGGVARGRAIPVAQDKERINLDGDETFTVEMHEGGGPAKHKMISGLSLAAESNFSVCVDSADAQTTGRLQGGDSHTHGLDVVRFSSGKSANKDRKLHKKQGPHVQTEPYSSDVGLVNTLDDYKVSVRHSSRGAKHKATDSTMKVTPGMCNLQVNVSKVSEDLSSQLHHHHHHVSLQQQLFDHKPLPEYTQQLPDIQLSCHSHQPGPANNYVYRYSGRYEILNAGSKISKNYLDVRDSFQRAHETFTSSVTNAQSYCWNSDKVGSYVQDANVFGSARCSDKLDIFQAKFCHHCGARFSVPSARFCCLCGMKRVKVTSGDFRNPV